MDGERLAGGRKPPGSAAQGRVCHAAGIYQRAAHRAHPGGGAQGRRDGYILCFKSGSGLAREEIERPIDKKLFDELETKIIGKPLIGKIRRSYALPDGLVLEVNHVDEASPLRSGTLRWNTPPWKLPAAGSRKPLALQTI